MIFASTNQPRSWLVLAKSKKKYLRKSDNFINNADQCPVT